MRGLNNGTGNQPETSATEGRSKFFFFPLVSGWWRRRRGFCGVERGVGDGSDTTMAFHSFNCLIVCVFVTCRSFDLSYYRIEGGELDMVDIDNAFVSLYDLTRDKIMCEEPGTGTEFPTVSPQSTFGSVPGLCHCSPWLQRGEIRTEPRRARGWKTSAEVKYKHGRNMMYIRVCV